MKYFASIFLACLLLTPAFTQSTKQKTESRPATQKKAAAAKPTPKKPSVASTAKKPAAKQTAQKPNARSTAQKPAAKPNDKKPPAAKPKSPKTTTAVVMEKAPDENESFEKAVAVTDPIEKVTALRKFLKDFPSSNKRASVVDLLVNTQVTIGNEKVASGDPASAVKYFADAVADSPTPITDQFFDEWLSKVPATLFWRGERSAAFDIARSLEEKCAQNATQLLGISSFYMSIENGGEAARVAENAIKIAPDSSAAYQALGLSKRIDFRLDDAAAAYAKALELEPGSLSARRGLAEIKRAIGRPDESAALYREILTGDGANLPARTGLILALFESGKRTDAETELATSLETNPGNVILLAGAAYWYAAQNEGQKAIEYAQKAIARDPRYIWSHIALARGQMAENKPLDAERTLLAARRYGNFPTLEYEIATARAKAGFYREASEELAKSFAVRDGKLTTRLGGRVDAAADDFIALLAGERQASIFASNAADSAENARQMRALLELTTILAVNDTDDNSISAAASEFAKGNDAMRVYRLLYTAKELLDRKKAVTTVIELANSAVGLDDEGMTAASPSAAVLAEELYDSRRLAATREEYIRAPDVPRQTLSAILRGRIEEINGWALYQTKDVSQAAVRLKRAISVLPADSSWWRSSMWKLGAALDADGKSGEALEAYIKSYKSGKPDVVRYSVIKSLYTQVNGSTEGLETKAGPDPSPPIVAEATDRKPEAVPEAAVTPSPSPKIGEVPIPAADAAKVSEDAKPAVAQPLPSPPETVPTPSPSPEVADKPLDQVKETNSSEVKLPVTEPDSTQEKAPKKSEPIVEPATSEVKVPAPTPDPTPENVVKQTDPVQAETKAGTDEKPKEKANAPATELFPPVIIVIPAPQTTVPPKQTEPQTVSRSDQNIPASEPPPTTEPKPADVPTSEKAGAEVRPRVIAGEGSLPPPCVVTLSEDSLTLANNGGDLAVIVGSDDEADLSGIKAISSSPTDVSVRLEPIAGIKGRALFVVRSVSSRTGLYQISFELPCGKKELAVTVR